MFDNCKSLLGLYKDTPWTNNNLTNMKNIFCNCSSLINLNIELD